jgi:hypothetical protein
MRVAVAVFLAVGLLLGVASSASATSSSGGWVLVGTAKWMKHAGDDRGPNYGIVTTSSGAGTYTNGTYGEADLNFSASIYPSQVNALSYDFNPEQGGPSGGSPRMVICFSDDTNPLDPPCSSNGELGPLNWTSPGSWTHVDGFAPSDGVNNVWINQGGSAGCASGPDTTWPAIIACHPGASITQVRVVNDSGWEFPANSYEQVTLDNLDVNGAIASGP